MTANALYIGVLSVCQSKKQKFHLYKLQKRIIMHYKIVKENKPTLKNCGRYKAVAVHYNTIDTERLCREIQDNCLLKKSDVIAVLAELSELLVRHLQDGDRVRLDGIGMLKLEIESDKVDKAEDFNVREHIRNFRIHLLPESIDGSQALYEGVKLEPAPIYEQR